MSWLEFDPEEAAVSYIQVIVWLGGNLDLDSVARWPACQYGRGIGRMMADRFVKLVLQLQADFAMELSQHAERMWTGFRDQKEVEPGLLSRAWPAFPGRVRMANGGEEATERQSERLVEEAELSCCSHLMQDLRGNNTRSNHHAPSSEILCDVCPPPTDFYGPAQITH